MTDLHAHYDKLAKNERQFVDNQFRAMFTAAREAGVSLFGDDTAERAVDAVAHWIIESRPTKATNDIAVAPLLAEALRTLQDAILKAANGANLAYESDPDQTLDEWAAIATEALANAGLKRTASHD